jgi:CheY-like chemotaxis protein
VDSEPGKGATFTLSLPEAPATKDSEAQPIRPGMRKAAHVLLVDDDPQVLSALVALLEVSGHSVSAAASGAAALKIYAPGRYDLVLANVGMAGMNGWEFAERLRAVDATVPMLFITGWGLREEDRARMVPLRIQRCLFKPIRPEELDAAIQSALPAAR